MTVGIAPMEAFCPRTELECSFRLELIDIRERYQQHQEDIVNQINGQGRFKQTIPGALTQTAPLKWLMTRIAGPEPNLQERLQQAQKTIVRVNNALGADCSNIPYCGTAIVYIADMERENSKT